MHLAKILFFVENRQEKRKFRFILIYVFLGRVHQNRGKHNNLELSTRKIQLERQALFDLAVGGAESLPLQSINQRLHYDASTRFSKFAGTGSAAIDEKHIGT